MACGPQDVYKALIAAGASTAQAIGVMANMINESGLNAEANAMDSNGYRSYGLVQWNARSYPNAAQLVTGNCQQDIKAQVKFLALTGGFTAASPDGSGTGAQAAGSFAANYERCQGCQPGGSQYQQRVGNAAKVESWITGGNWPTSSGSGGGGTTTTSSASSDSSTCVIGIPGVPGTSWLNFFGSGNIGQACLVSKSQARAVIGAGLMVTGGLIAAVGLAFIAVFALQRTGIAQTIVNITPAGKLAGAMPKPKPQPKKTDQAAS